MNNAEQLSSEQLSPLNSWIESVLFGMNLLLGGIGSVLVYRYGLTAREAFRSFDVSVPRLTEIALAPFYVFILPILLIFGIGLYFLTFNRKLKIITHILHFIFIMTTIGFFVATTVPVMHRLTQQLLG